MGLVIQVNKAIGSITGRVSADHRPLGSSSTPLGGIILIYAPHHPPSECANDNEYVFETVLALREGTDRIESQTLHRHRR